MSHSIAIVSSLVGLSLIGIAWVQYLAAIPAEKVPRRPRGTLVAMTAGSVAASGALAAAAFAPTWSVVPAAGIATVALGLAGFFVYLLRQAPLPDGELVVAIGSALPSFTARDGTGVLVSSAAWQGRRTLLKFFRGHW